MLLKKLGQRSVEKMKSMRLLAVVRVPVFALMIVGVTAPEILAQGPLDVSFIFETNFTDKDTGIQLSTDGDPWREVTIYYPNGDELVSIVTSGDLENFGLTELFSESNEPNWDEELSLRRIIALFPAGDYVFEGVSVEGENLEGVATLSHELPCAPENLSPEEGEIVPSADPVTITWDEVENKLNNNAERCSTAAGDDIEIEGYQLIAENLTTEKEFSIFLDDETTAVTLPAQFVSANQVIKYEVLAIAENGNQTIAEVPFFCTDLDPCLEPPE
jgi:hypothetical protein